ncbi:MAG: hypothetical protein EOP34_00620 [Rickettsiales bacterium]|nr:MAG: hypothetical protein EOP34_00620 [Rickettsiales bacterium]
MLYTILLFRRGNLPNSKQVAMIFLRIILVSIICFIPFDSVYQLVIYSLPLPLLYCLDLEMIEFDVTAVSDISYLMEGNSQNTTDQSMDSQMSESTTDQTPITEGGYSATETSANSMPITQEEDDIYKKNIDALEKQVNNYNDCKTSRDEHRAAGDDFMANLHET